LIITVAAVIEPLLVVAGARISGRLGDSPRLARRMNRGLGALFIALGAKLALSDRA